MMTLQEFYDRLQRHDWYYAFSDDHRYWLAGEKSIKEIKAIAEEGGDEYYDLYVAYYKHKFSGDSWGTEKAPKPERPE